MTPLFRSRPLAATLLLASAALGCNSGAPEPPASSAAHELDRQGLDGGLVHERFELRTGEGELAAVHVHRVARERAPGEPAADGPAVLLLPGHPNFFEAVFLPPSISRAIPRDRALAIFLAERGFDVWGMDYGWALMPEGAADFEPLRDWGVERDARDVALALGYARGTRRAEGIDDGPIDLVGFSYGGVVAYAVAGAEIARPREQRDVGGLVALDIGWVLDAEPLREHYCGVAEADRARLAQGMLSDHVGLFTRALAERAISSPDEPSPDVEGMSNLQAALAFGSSTWLLNGQFWHFVGGELDEEGIPSGLRFTEPRLWFDLLSSIPPNAPTRVGLEVAEALCGRAEPRFAAHLGEIEVPILQLGAAGGVGPRALETAARTASRSVTDRLVRRLPEGEERSDFGHADLLLAREAPELVWGPLADWLRAKR